MDATTTRASTVIRSMPTSETRTQASMTMPLSRTRSRTSMRLVPPAVRSTGMGQILLPPGDPPAGGRSLADHGASRRLCLWRNRLGIAGPRELGDAPLHRLDLYAQALRLRPCHAAGRQVLVVLPPVEADLLRLVDRAHDQADADGQELDFREGHADVARDQEALVEHPVEDVDEARAAMRP